MKKLFTSLLLGFSLAFLIAGCAQKEVSSTLLPNATAAPAKNTPENAQSQSPQASAQAGAFTLTSSAFQEGQEIPTQYTCDGENRSPSLSWTEPPEGAQSFALLVDDPDARGFAHWVLYNLPPGTRSLPEGLPAVSELPDGSQQGVNGFGKAGYGGPCPPSGTHRYSFRLYALDKMLDIDPRMEKSGLEQAMAQHVLATGELIGKFTRK